MGGCSDRLTIGIDGRELLGDRVTGIGRYLRNFLHSRARSESRHRFIVYGNQHTCFDPPGDNIVYRRIEEHATLWWDQILLPRETRRDRLDLFFSPYDKGPLFCPCPLVLTFHDLFFLRLTHRTGLSRLLYNTLYLGQRWCFTQKATRILTVSTHSRNELTQTLGVSPEKTRITYNGISDRYRPAVGTNRIRETSNRYGLTPDYILYVGNFSPHKNVNRLIEAYGLLRPDLRQKHPLALAGTPGPFNPALEDLVRRLHLESRVRFTGTIADDDMPALYGGAAIFVLPSLSEGFGLPALEAMACGTPVLASRTTALPEVVGDAGLLVDVTRPDKIRNAMETLLTKENIRRACIASGLERARRFTLEHTARLILQTLEEAWETSRERL